MRCAEIPAETQIIVRVLTRPGEYHPGGAGIRGGAFRERGDARDLGTAKIVDGVRSSKLGV
jgi:hypothetical protein